MIAWLLAALAQGAEVEPEPETRVSASLVVAVSQREDVANALVAKARELGGWFQARTPEAVSLRVPVEQADALVAFAAEQGKVIDRSLARQDASQELADLRGRLDAREEVLKRYYAVLAEAGAKSIVAVERQIVAAIEEIERLRGRIRMLEDQAAHARVDVAFQFRDRSAPARDGSSSFRWLNTLNVQDVILGLQARSPGWRTAATVPAPPEGFSAWKRERRYRAASPDGVLFRVRSVRHRPKAELAFWKEAVRERMIAAGYRLAGESDLEAGGIEGGLVELVAPMGTEDWTYLVAFFPTDGEVIVAEAAGEISEVEARKDAVLDAIRAIRP